MKPLLRKMIGNNLVIENSNLINKTSQFEKDS